MLCQAQRHEKANWRYSSVFLTLNLTEVCGQLNVPTDLSLRKQRYPSRRRLGWPQSWSQRGTEKKNCSTGSPAHSLLKILNKLPQLYPK